MVLCIHPDPEKIDVYIYLYIHDQILYSPWPSVPMLAAAWLLLPVLESFVVVTTTGNVIAGY